LKNQIFIHAKEVAIELGISEAHVYKIVRNMNKELRKQGFMTISGRVSRKYFHEKFYGMEGEKVHNVSL
jgi:hypothetical protein